MSGEFWPWWWGAVALGGTATLYPFLSGRLLGVSSLYASLVAKRAARSPSVSALEQALIAETEAEFGPSVESQGPRTFQESLAHWRVGAENFRPLFLVGMVLGPSLASLWSGDFRVSLTLGAGFDLRYGTFGALPIAVLVLSGILIGFGTRLSGGCTSGHGISGLARAQPGSLLTAAVFWATAVAVAWGFVLLGSR